jgi:hypothetical protein
MRVAFLLGWAGMLAAQAVSIGVKGGVRGTDDLGGTFGTSESKRYVVGPMLTARLPLGFRLEFDALYRRVGFRSLMNTDIGGSVAERDTGNSWEFPILVRRTLWHGLYAGVGYAPRVISGLRHLDEVSILSLTPPLKAYSEFSLPGSWDTTDGVVVEGGIEKRAGRLRIAPELRYIHWSPHALNVQQPHGQFIVSTQDQADVLVGITFRGATR